MGAPRQAAKTHSSNTKFARPGEGIAESKLRCTGDPEGKKLPKGILAMRRQREAEVRELRAQSAAAAPEESEPEGLTDYILRSHVFLQFDHPCLPEGARLVYKLNDDLVRPCLSVRLLVNEQCESQAPMACANFRALCT